jgi:heptosyltransferase I
LRFLISRLSALGDTVCSLPAAAALKRAFPECHVTWAVDPRFAGIVECCEAVDEVVRVKPGLRPETWPRYEQPFDAALDLQGLLKSGLAIVRAKAPLKLGYHWQREGAWLFSRRVLPDPTSIHVVDQYVDVARAAGGEADRADFALRPRGDDLASIRSKLPDRPFVILNAGAGWATKRWPPAAFAELADRLADARFATALIGGKAAADREAADEVLRRAKRPPVDLLGQTSVRELVALVSECRAHVGGDTGSTHLAAALGKPSIGLYSITRPERTGPYGQIDNCLFHSDGLANISTDEVWQRLERYLRG